VDQVEVICEFKVTQLSN